MRSQRALASLFLSALIAGLDMIRPSPVDAQVRLTTLDDLRREVSPGDFVSVVQTTGDSVRGRLLRFGDTDLEIRAETQQHPGQQRRRLNVTIACTAIQSLERLRDSVRNGVLIGAGVGAGVSLAMFVQAAAVDYNEIDEWAPIYVGVGGALTGIGALIGWAVDAAHSKPHVRFDASSRATMKIRLVPVFSRAPGMALVVSF